MFTSINKNGRRDAGNYLKLLRCHKWSPGSGAVDGANGAWRVGPAGCPLCTECGTALWSAAMLEARAEHLGTWGRDC